MLVLTRKVGERLIVPMPDGEITIQVMGVQGNKIKLGVDAPDSVKIYREEIWDKIVRPGELLVGS